MRNLGSDTFVRVRAPLATDPVDQSSWRDWENATRVSFSNCLLMPYILAEKIQYEDNRSREFSRTSIRVFCPAGTDMKATDRIEFEGRTYDVFGNPQPWRRFSGVEVYVSFDARERVG